MKEFEEFKELQEFMEGIQYQEVGYQSQGAFGGGLSRGISVCRQQAAPVRCSSP